MFHKIKEVYAMEDYYLVVIFTEGVTKKYDVKPLFKKWEIFNNLKKNDLFSKVHPCHGGYAAEWNDEIDISCDDLYYDGVKIDTIFDNLLSFSDAAFLWKLDESTLRKNISYKRFIRGIDVNKFGKQWVVSVDAMTRLYGPRKI